MSVIILEKQGARVSKTLFVMKNT